MLEVFQAESEIGVSELARQLGLHKNNAFRLLATLELAGYMQQTPSTELYHLGPKCLELGHAFARSHTLMNQARPVLEELAQGVGETAHLGVLSGRQVVHLDGVLPGQLVLTGLRVGERLDAHCTALGKALLAGELANRSLPGLASASSGAPGHGLETSTALAEELAEADLTRYTEETLVDHVKLLDDLRVVQLRGYATDLEEFAQGVHCVAAPVRDASARVVAALSLSGPSLRLAEEKLHGAVASAVCAAADQLSHELGSPV
jgi:DNA-binding IclR family transcriptional regulator